VALQDKHIAAIDRQHGSIRPLGIADPHPVMEELGLADMSK
jgi:hypothetical protein